MKDQITIERSDVVVDAPGFLPEHSHDQEAAEVRKGIETTIGICKCILYMIGVLGLTHIANIILLWKMKSWEAYLIYDLVAHMLTAAVYMIVGFILAWRVDVFVLMLRRLKR